MKKKTWNGKRILCMVLSVIMVCSLFTGMNSLTVVAAEEKEVTVKNESGEELTYKTDSHEIMAYGWGFQDGTDIIGKVGSKWRSVTYDYGGFAPYYRINESEGYGTKITFQDSEGKVGKVGNIDINNDGTAELTVTPGVSFSDDGKLIYMSYTVANQTNSDIEKFDFGVWADTYVNNNDASDNSPLILDENVGAIGFTMTDTLDPESIDGKEVNVSFVLACKGVDGVATPADQYWYGDLEDEEVEASAFSKTEDSAYDDDYFIADSGIAYSWTDRTIPAEGSVTFTVACGIGDLETLKAALGKTGAKVDYASETISGLQAGEPYKITITSDGADKGKEYYVTAGTEGSVLLTGTGKTGTGEAAQNIAYDLIGKSFSIVQIDKNTGAAVTEETKLTVSGRPQTQPAAESEVKIGANQITLTKTVAGQVYAIVPEDGSVGNDTDWVKSAEGGSITFDNRTGGKDYTIYTKIEATNEAPASLPSEVVTITAEKIAVAAAKDAVDAALASVTVSNAVTQESLLADIKGKLTAAGIDVTSAGVTVTVDDFAKTNATSKKAGSIKGTITITKGSETETVTIDKTIAQLERTDATAVAETKAVVEDVMSKLVATNDTTKADIQTAMDNALSEAGITDVTVTVADFAKTNATSKKAGSIKGTITITKGSKTETVIIDKIIAQLERTDATAVAEIKAVVEDVLSKKVVATNSTTKADIQAVMDNALSEAGITDVTVTVGELTKTAATSSAAGSIAGKIIIKKGDATESVSINQTIGKLPENDADKIAAAKTAVQNALADVIATNNTTKADIQAVIDNALTKSGITDATVTVGEFTKTAATSSAKGSITGKIIIKKGDITESVSINETIEKLPESAAEKVAAAKTAVQNALADVIATNNTTKADIQAVIDNALTKAGITGVSAGVDNMELAKATNEAAGLLIGSVNIVCGTVSEKADLVKTIDKLPLSAADKVAAAKRIAQKTINNMIVTNNTTKTDICDAISNALGVAGLADVSVALGSWEKFYATEEETGSLSAIIGMRNGDKEDGIDLNKTIDKLPSEDPARVEAAKVIVQKALETFAVTNATTKEDIENAINAALDTEGMGNIEVAVSAFDKEVATASKTGELKTTITISRKDASDTINMVKVIEELPVEDKAKVAAAKRSVQEVLDSVLATNSTTKEEIEEKIKAALDKEKIADVEIKVESFDVVSATEDDMGSISLKITVRKNDETENISCRKLIWPLNDCKHVWSDFTISIPATEESAGLEYRKCLNCGVKRYSVIPAVGQEKESLGNQYEGDIEKVVESKINAPAAALNNTKQEFLTKILTEEEQEKIKEGENARIWMEVDAQEANSVDEKNKQQMKQKADEAMGGDAELFYFDASLFKKIGNRESVQIHEPGMEVSVTLTIPEELRNKDTNKRRKFKIVRQHDTVSDNTVSDNTVNDNTCDMIDGDYNEETGEFTFETDKFSLYAIAYVDENVTTGNPSTGETANPGTGESRNPEADGAAIKDESGITGNDLEKRTDLPLLLTKGAQKSSSSIRLTWRKESEATGYEVYWSYCNGKNNFKKLKTVNASAKRRCTHKKLKKNKAYKYYVAAYKEVDGKKIYISKSPTIYVAMSYEKRTNAKAITVKKAKVTLNLNSKKTFKIKAKTKKQDDNKKVLSRAKALRYYTSDKNVATVSSKGKITAKGTGKCTVYVIANNGVYKKVSVTVK